MNVPVEWIYLVVTVPFIIVWCAVWVFAAHTRREQVRMSIAFALIGVLVENVFYLKDYWRPASVFPIDLGLFVVYPEFFLFGAAFGGITAVIYPALCSVREHSRDPSHVRRRLIVAGVAFLVPSMVLFALGINSIYATSCGALILAGYAVFQRPDLRIASFTNGVLAVGIMFACYSLVWALVSNMEHLLAAVWLLYDTPLDVRVSGIPLTELVWGFSVGASVGVIRAYVKGIRYTASVL